jgi:hypothetical protein
MPRKAIIHGSDIATLRSKKRWTRNDLAVRMQLLGLKIAPEAILQIETLDLPVTQRQMVLIAEAFYSK